LHRVVFPGPRGAVCGFVVERGRVVASAPYLKPSVRRAGADPARLAALLGAAGARVAHLRYVKRAT